MNSEERAAAMITAMVVIYLLCFLYMNLGLAASVHW